MTCAEIHFEIAKRCNLGRTDCVLEAAFDPYACGGRHCLFVSPPQGQSVPSQMRARVITIGD